MKFISKIKKYLKQKSRKPRKQKCNFPINLGISTAANMSPDQWRLQKPAAPAAAGSADPCRGAGKNLGEQFEIRISVTDKGIIGKRILTNFRADEQKKGHHLF